MAHTLISFYRICHRSPISIYQARIITRMQHSISAVDGPISGFSLKSHSASTFAPLSVAVIILIATKPFSDYFTHLHLAAWCPEVDCPYWLLFWRHLQIYCRKFTFKIYHIFLLALQDSMYFPKHLFQSMIFSILVSLILLAITWLSQFWVR